MSTSLALQPNYLPVACGWPHDLTDEQILERLLALNLERAAK